MLDIFGLTSSPKYSSVAFALAPDFPIHSLKPQDHSTHGTTIAKVEWKEGDISKRSRWLGVASLSRKFLPF